MITVQTLVAEQTGNNPITFAPKNAYTFKLVIEANGVRKLLRSNGSVQSAADGSFTTLMYNNKEIPPDRRFARFPQGTILKPGMKWDVPVWKTNTDCYPMDVKYTALSENGPDVNMILDGKEMTIKTIQIKYESAMPGCEGKNWRLTQEILFANELNEIISSKSIGWSVYNPKLHLSGGSGWVVTAIQTASKQEPK